MKQEEMAVYEKAVKRLRRAGITDSTRQIIYLEREIDFYRQRIQALIEHYRQQLHIDGNECLDLHPDAVANNRYDAADIVTRPTCGACGTILEDVAAIVSYTTYGETGYTSRSHRIKPDRCPKCGRWFKTIQQKIIQPEVERQP